MKSLRIVLCFLFASITYPLMAQPTKQDVKLESKRASIVMERGEQHLILLTGRKTGDIVIRMGQNLWRSLDSLIKSPLGASVWTKTVSGYKVLIQHGNVNSQKGLMFSTGSDCVAITDKDFLMLKTNQNIY